MTAVYLLLVKCTHICWFTPQIEIKRLSAISFKREWHFVQRASDMMVSINNAHWYGIQVRSNHERAVARFLDVSGIETFVPCFEIGPQKRQHKLCGQILLFPGYLFAYFQWESGPRMYSIPGIVRVLGSAGKPIPIDLEEIHAIQRVASSPMRPTPCTYLAAGQSVIVIDGPLRGIKGFLVDNCKGSRLVLSVELMHRSLALTIDRQWVRPV